jgi:hypothetical protein
MHRPLAFYKAGKKTMLGKRDYAGKEGLIKVRT